MGAKRGLERDRNKGSKSRLIADTIEWWAIKTGKIYRPLPRPLRIVLTTGACWLAAKMFGAEALLTHAIGAAGAEISK